MAAKNILQVAERVEKALIEAQNIQKEVNDGIFTTNQNIVDATNSLTKVSTFIIWVKLANIITYPILKII